MGATGIYDPVGKRMVIFGGHDGALYYNDIWAFDFTNRQWSQLTPGGFVRPAARAYHAASYDPLRQRMVVWSGQTTGGLPADTDVWVLSLFPLTWHRVQAPAPPPRYGSVSIYLPFGDRLAIFGGFSRDGQANDIQVFNFVPQTWQGLLAVTFTPTPRSFHAGGYDPVKYRLIIYGGQTFTFQDDLWAFSFATSTWDSLSPPAPRPAGRYLTSAVTTRDNQILLFGGRTSGTLTNDVWQYSIARNRWTQHVITGAQPEPREGHAATYRADEDKMVIFGGRGATVYNDLWEFSKPVTSVAREAKETPSEFLLQNSPNPFNASTQISFYLPRSGNIRLAVYNVLGIEVAMLVEGIRTAGTHTVTWNAYDVPSGVYVCRLSADNFVAVRKMVLMK